MLWRAPGVSRGLGRGVTAEHCSSLGPESYYSVVLPCDEVHPPAFISPWEQG